MSALTVAVDGGPHGLAVDVDGAVWVALESGFVVRLPV